MNAFNSMKNKLNALGVYKITKGSNVYNELKSYAVALDEHRDLLDEILIDSSATIAFGEADISISNSLKKPSSCA